MTTALTTNQKELVRRIAAIDKHCRHLHPVFQANMRMALTTTAFVETRAFVYDYVGWDTLMDEAMNTMAVPDDPRLLLPPTHDRKHSALRISLENLMLAILGANPKAREHPVYSLTLQRVQAILAEMKRINQGDRWVNPDPEGCAQVASLAGKIVASSGHAEQGQDWKDANSAVLDMLNIELMMHWWLFGYNNGAYLPPDLDHLQKMIGGLFGCDDDMLHQYGDWMADNLLARLDIAQKYIAAYFGNNMRSRHAGISQQDQSAAERVVNCLRMLNIMRRNAAKAIKEAKE